MRKRILIGLLAIVVIGVVALFATQPKKGSVEWHKREYLRLMQEIEGKTLKQRGLMVWRKITGAAMRSQDVDRTTQIKQMLEHWQELLRCGYFVERRFVIRDSEARAKISREWRSWVPENCRNYTWLLGEVGAATVLVVGRPKDILMWEKIIEEAHTLDWGDLLVPKIGVPGS